MTRRCARAWSHRTPVRKKEGKAARVRQPSPFDGGAAATCFYWYWM